MTKKNKSKRNKKLEDFSSLYIMLDDYPNTFDNGGNLKDTLLGAGMGAIGNIGGNLISGGKSTGFGNTIGSLGNTIGGAAMAVNPIVGGAIMAGSQIVGGITNALFGSKLNNERIALAENEIGKARSFNANASNFDDLSLQMASLPVIAGFSLSDIGSDGLFSNKAKNKYRELLALKQQAESWVDRSIANNTANLQLNQMNNLLLNYAAFGGPLGYGFDGALGYDLATQQLGINAIKAIGLNRQYSLPNMGLNTFAEGGEIHIKPSRKGTFTAAAKKHGKGVQEFASLVLANKENYSPAMVKKAQFARNATKFKHEDGGSLSNLVADINKRSNADFVQRLLDPNRAFILDWATDGIATHKLGWATDDKGDAIVFPNVQRINGKLYDFTDPKNKRMKWDALDSAIERGDTLRMSPKQAEEFTKTYKNYYPKGATFKAEGGPLYTNGTVFSNNVNIIGNGNSHEDNIYGGVQVGVDSLGIPNLVEENEVIWNDYVFSDRIKVPKTVKEKLKLKGNKNMTFADAANKILKISEERPNDPISMETMDINLTRLALEQEALRQQKNLGQEGRKYAKGGTKRNRSLVPSFTLGTRWLNDFTDSRLNTMLATNNTNPLGLTKDDFAKVGMVYEDPYANVTFDAKKNTNRDNNTNNNYATWLRYAPVAGSILGLSLTLLSNPDYSRADALALYAQNTGLFLPITYNPLGNYLTYNPTDINYLANRAAALAGATRRNIMNTAGGNRANAVGSLLAADYNAQLALGELLRQAEEANLGRRMQVESFNRGTNLANSEMALKAAIANQEARLKASQMGLSGYTTAMQMKDAIDALRNASINANLSSLFESLGNIGMDEYNRMDRDMLIKSGVFGTLNDIAKKSAGIKNAKGGKLNRKKRGGFTY